MKLALGSDHGGYELKETLKKHLTALGHSVDDTGCFSTEAVDYPDYAVQVARRVAAGTADLGIMIDGAGIGSAMAANKVTGVRAAVCNDLYTARNAREHNNANLLTLGSMVVGPGKALQIAELFVNTAFAGGRHERRVQKIDRLDAPGTADPAPAEPDISRIVRQVMDRFSGVAGTPESPPDQPEISTTPRVVTEEWLRDLVKAGKTSFTVRPNTIITPLARDFIRDRKIDIRS